MQISLFACIWGRSGPFFTGHGVIWTW